MTGNLSVLFLSLALLLGCGQGEVHKTLELGSFIDVLKQNGVDGTVEIAEPDNADIEYVVTYVIAAFTSTRILSFFKCTDEESAERYFQESLQNPKLSGQARNGRILFAATFYPPDDAAVEKIRELFLAQKFE